MQRVGGRQTSRSDINSDIGLLSKAANAIVITEAVANPGDPELALQVYLKVEMTYQLMEEVKVDT